MTCFASLLTLIFLFIKIKRFRTKSKNLARIARKLALPLCGTAMSELQGNETARNSPFENSCEVLIRSFNFQEKSESLSQT